MVFCSPVLTTLISSTAKFGKLGFGASGTGSPFAKSPMMRALCPCAFDDAQQTIPKKHAVRAIWGVRGKIR
jgi:hypothetical protein